MGRIRSPRPGQRLSHTPAGSPDAARLARTFRPRLELLEDRVQLGDTILGLSAVALWGLNFTCLDAPLALDPDANDRSWHHALFSSLDEAGSLLPEDSRSDEAGHATSGNHAVTAEGAETVGGFALPILASADTLAGQMAVYRLASPAFPLSQELPVELGITGGGVGTPWLGGGVPFSLLALAAIGESGGRSPELVAAAGAATSTGRVNLSFDGSTGQLAIQANAGEHTVREAVAADGFLEMTLDGQRHSSNPSSASFDRALAGATSATVAGINFDGGGQDKLDLGSQHLAGGLTVQAAGATVVMENVVTAGPMVIQAPNITVRGALQANTVSLAASAWVTVDAAGRIDGVPSPGRAGSVSALSTIVVAARVFVNSGQLHADGPSGGQIFVQAGNVLNAGLITADSTGPGGSGGQVGITFTGSYIATTAAVLSASSPGGPGGQVSLDGGRTGRLYSSGRQQATGTVGGAVDLFGRDVVLAGATVDASGDAGAGSVRVGGDFQGRNPAVVNADTVTVTPATTIRANALRSGSGGRVAVWAGQNTTFAGVVSAQGGSAGGFIEVSGKGGLSYQGSADAAASKGMAGTLLLDPKNLVIADGPAGVFPQFDLIDPHPAAAGGFGSQVFVLDNGNVVVTNPTDDFGGANAGAVYLFDGLSGALISSLVGSHPGDLVGGGVQYYPQSPGHSDVTLLSNGNYLVESPYWSGNRGAVTWGNAVTGVSGTVSDANSLVGSNPNDQVGAVGVYPVGDLVTDLTLLDNGNYVVASPQWNDGRGAVTWGNGNTGVSGIVSDANSLVGSNPGDLVGSGIEPSRHEPYHAGVVPLSNGNYVVDSPNWNGGYPDGLGAVTWGNGTTGVSGPVTDANSLVGSNPGDYVGSYGVTALSDGNYVVDSPNWNGDFNGLGAVTWGNGSTGISGTITDINSLVGSNPGDRVGDMDDNTIVGYSGITSLSNGNYMVDSPFWNDRRGAVTWGNGSTGVSGTVSVANSLVGSNPGDLVGTNGYLAGVTALSNGNYVVPSPNWNDKRGAVTWGNGSTGVTGHVSDANSLVGSNSGNAVSNTYDQVGQKVVPLSDGNYLVTSPYWNVDRGAVTWGNGSTGVSGTVSEANSLVGSHPGSSDPNEANPGDLVGYDYGYYDPGVLALSNGNYVVQSPYWNGKRGAVTWGDGSTGANGVVSDANSLVGSHSNDNVGGIVAALSNGNYMVDSPDWNGGYPNGRGATTWGNGSTGVSGTVSEANSLVGSNPGDEVGNGYIFPLTNGNFVVDSPFWNASRGAATWGNGATGLSGSVSEANSLVGSNSGDRVGDYFCVTPLSNGNYVVQSPYWSGGYDNGLGAVTWGNGSTGVSGIVSESNSLVGSYPGDRVGDYPGVTQLSNGNYVIDSPHWKGQRGAVTWLNGTTGRTLDSRGVITTQNSLVDVRFVGESPIHQSFLAAGGGRLTVGLTDPNQFSYARSQAQTVTLTPDFLTRTLSAGTSVVLQASNDITVNSPITVSAGGQGGTLTLQAGRSLNLNASITTDNGALALIANDQVANGVVDSQRDPGQAVITMAPGTTLDTGSGALTVELRDGAGLTNRGSGAIWLQTVRAGSVSVVNNGPAAGSDVLLGAVTTTGPQSYSNPNGTTTVTGNITTADKPITFNHSVVLNPGLTLSAGSSTVNFVAGTVAPRLGVITVVGGVAFAGLTTFSVTLNGTDPGSYSQVAAGGPINLGGSTLSLVLGYPRLPVGSTFEIVTNTGTGPITGTFNGLAEGAVFTQGGYQFKITYHGGTGGSSVVLTRA